MNLKLYNILNLNKDATQKDIKSSYRKLAVKYHPDNNINDKNSENKYKEISHAYNILSNIENKKKYDLYGDNNNELNNNNPFQSFNEIFKSHVESFMNINTQNCDIGNIINNLKKTTSTLYENIEKNKINNPLNNPLNKKKKRNKKIKGKPKTIIIPITCSLEDMYIGKKHKIQIDKKKSNGNKVIDIINVFNIPIIGDELLIEEYGHDLNNYTTKGDVIIKINNIKNDKYKRINKYDLVINYKIKLYDFYHNKEINIILPNNEQLLIEYNYLEMIKSQKYNFKIKSKGFPYLNMKDRGYLFINFIILLPENYNEISENKE